MRCPICNSKAIWGADHDFSDFSMEEEGVVSTYTCVNDECTVDVYIIFQKEKNDETNREIHSDKED
jgi:hypothetical protein